MSSAICFNLEQSKNLRSGNELNTEKAKLHTVHFIVLPLTQQLHYSPTL